jgi:hypothetical protein
MFRKRICEAGVAFFFLIVCSSVCAQKKILQSVPVPPHIVAQGGLFFALPKTVFRVDVVIRIADKRRGIYSPFTSKYFHVNDYIKADSREYSIKEIRITPLSMPDENQVYFLSTRQARGLSLQVDDRGIIRSLNANTSYDSKTKSFLPTESRAASESSPLPTFIQPRFSYRADTVINRELSRDSTIVERRYVTKKLVEKSLEEYAREAYDKLQDIRKRRYDFLSDPSELNLDGAGLSLLLSELDKMEKAILELFFGNTYYSEKMVSFLYEPTAQPEQPLFNFTRDKGLQFNAKHIRGIETVVMELRPQSGINPNLASHSSQSKNNKSTNPIPYRIPMQAHVRLVQDDNVLFEGEFTLPQHGSINYLKVKDLHKVRILYDTVTGSLLSVDFAR